jgi:hypothetical protein
MPFPIIYQPKSAADSRPETRAIFRAINASDYQSVKAALDAGEDVNITGAFKISALHYACSTFGRKAGAYGFSHPREADRIIKLLVDSGASLTARDAYGHMPNALCNGHGPRWLAALMQDLAATGSWPERNPGGIYDEDDIRLPWPLTTLKKAA